MTRAEVADTLDVSLNTATKYLQQLVAEDFVQRIEPNASPRTHYFRLRSP
jgi:Fic family protein